MRKFFSAGLFTFTLVLLTHSIALALSLETYSFTGTINGDGNYVSTSHLENIKNRELATGLAFNPGDTFFGSMTFLYDSDINNNLQFSYFIQFDDGLSIQRNFGMDILGGPAISNTAVTLVDCGELFSSGEGMNDLYLSFWASNGTLFDGLDLPDSIDSSVINSGSIFFGIMQGNMTTPYYESIYVSGSFDSIGICSIPQPAPIPEPATMLLFGTGLASSIGLARRKKN